MNENKTHPKSLKASDFLRQRRPENYSDSIITQEPQINRSILEYHLNQITSHSEEKSFEYLARRLLEKEVCPNLIPQTGPTAGGDSKTDSETYPVSDEIALRWYQGEGSAKERWAVAVSAQKEWQPKIKNDVKSIVSTNRGYSLIYFVTNQPVPDKKRAEVEDALKAEYKVDVRILSRDWIVDKIITNRHFDLVVDNLPSAKDIKFESSRKLGPRDSGREVEFAELEKQIADADRYQGLEFQLAEDCLSCALLASKLERPRELVDGLFARAIRVARKVGDTRQILRFIYRKAWISFFTYDDVDELSSAYDEVEKLALQLGEISDLELLHTLVNVLAGAVRFNQITVEAAKIPARSATLKQALNTLSQDKSRPNSSLCARTFLCLHNLAIYTLFPDSTPSPDQTFSELLDIFKASKGLGEYPFEAYAEIITEIGKFCESQPYEDLFDEILNQASARKLEGEAGTLLVARGSHKLQLQKPYDAIKLFGKAQQFLIKEEYKEDLVKCLLMCGSAYKDMGLLWAARSQMLSALSYTLKAFHQTGVMHNTAVLGAKELAWIEIELGRVPQIIFCIKLADFIAAHAELSETQGQIYASSRRMFDLVLAVLLLKSKFGQLKHLTTLPYLLDREQLDAAEFSLLFALGHIEKLREYEMFPSNTSDKEIEEFFSKVCSQPADKQLPEAPELFNERTSKLIGHVLGCDVIFEVDSNRTSILIAEALLSAIEAFFATSLKDGMAYRSEVHIRIMESEGLSNDFGVLLEDKDLALPVEIKHVKNFELGSKEAILKFRDMLHYFIAIMVPRIAVFKDFESHLKQLAEEEDVFGRAFIFSEVITLSANVFGNHDWLDLAVWTEKMDITPYTVKREQQWTPEKSASANSKQEPLQRGEGEPPPEMLDPNNQRHSDMKVLSIINIPLWDKAKWRGTFFMGDMSNQYPPTLGLMYTNEEAARSIFSEWKKKWGDYDSNEELKITIIRGIDKKNPAHYIVSVSVDLEKAALSTEKKYIIASRYNRMTPDSTVNLDQFLTHYDKMQGFYLVPAVANGPNQTPRVLDDLPIIKRKIFVRSAWEIGENDEDIAVLDVDDEPIIPQGIESAPVLKALERKKKFT